MERQLYDDMSYHKTCFKCLSCASTLSISAVAKIKGDLYCRVCFKKIFKEKGTYASFGAKTLAANAPMKDVHAAATSRMSVMAGGGTTPGSLSVTATAGAGSAPGSGAPTPSSAAAAAAAATAAAGVNHSLFYDDDDDDEPPVPTPSAAAKPATPASAAAPAAATAPAKPAAVFVATPTASAPASAATSPAAVTPASSISAAAKPAAAPAAEPESDSSTPAVTPNAATAAPVSDTFRTGLRPAAVRPGLSSPSSATAPAAVNSSAPAASAAPAALSVSPAAAAAAPGDAAAAAPEPPLSAKAAAIKRFSVFTAPAPTAKCVKCSKTVYDMEKQVYDNEPYHKTCFKCLSCSSTLGITAVAKIKGDLYCKVCFKKIFKEKGTYASFGAKTLAANAPMKDVIAAQQSGATNE